MKQYSEAHVHDALVALADGMPWKAASRLWHIPLSTLRRRRAGAPNHIEAADPQRLLSDVQEAQLALFIINQSSLGLALSRFETRALAAHLAFPHENRPPLGRKWLRHFLFRHPELRSRKHQRVEAIRLRATTKANISTWFDLLQLPIVKSILPDHRWNADEGVMMEGRSEDVLALGYSNNSPIAQLDYNSRAWTSYIECVNALGKRLDPLIIFKGKSVQQHCPSLPCSCFFCAGLSCPSLT